MKGILQTIIKDKVSKLQKVVTASEQDRIVLSERLEAAKGAIAELKKQLGNQGETSCCS